MNKALKEVRKQAIWVCGGKVIWAQGTAHIKVCIWGDAHHAKRNTNGHCDWSRMNKARGTKDETQEAMEAGSCRAL